MTCSKHSGHHLIKHHNIAEDSAPPADESPVLRAEHDGLLLLADVALAALRLRLQRHPLVLLRQLVRVVHPASTAIQVASATQPHGT